MNFGWRKLALGMAFVSVAAVACTQDFNAFQFQTTSGAGASSATSTGSAGECSGPDMCTQGNACKKATCIDGACGFQMQTAGAPCMENGGAVCDGLGTCVECNKNSDCNDAKKPLCDKKKCVPIQCMDGMKNGNETDVDCGGTDAKCAKCADGKVCLLGADCASNFCKIDSGAGGAGGGGGGMAAGPGVCASCAGDADCGKDGYCNDKKVCTPKGMNGDVCTAADQCGSGFCADGRCCNSKCDGTCVGCSNAKTGGKDGECAAFKKGDDPDKECGAVMGNTCGPLGMGCSGAALDPMGTTSACQVADAMTSCITASCDSAKHTQTAAATCDGKGACPMPMTSSCGKYECDANKTACLKDCKGKGELDCLVDAYCDTGACKACGVNPNPPGAMQCPAECSSCTNKNVCIKNCSGNSCANFVCPAGYDCQVNCASNEVCKNATITCPDVYDCSVDCNAAGACDGATIKAKGTGTLSLHCGSQSDACKDTVETCGINQCAATCDGLSKPKTIANCGGGAVDSCKCTAATCL